MFLGGLYLVKGLSVEMITLRLGEEQVTIGGEEETVDVFRHRMKLVSLLNAIGKAGRAALTSLAFDQESATSTYGEPWNICKLFMNLKKLFMLKQ